MRISRKQKGGIGTPKSGSRRGPSRGTSRGTSRKPSSLGFFGAFSRLTKRVKNAFTSYKTKINRIFANEDKRRIFLEKFSGSVLYVPTKGRCTGMEINEGTTSGQLIEYMNAIESSDRDCRNDEIMSALFSYIKKVY